MSETGQNFIAGAWCDGQSTIVNINPSDLSDQIGHYAQADSAQLDRALDAAQTCPEKMGRHRS
jgi:aldehyde dehydrogenase (NAD+)